MRCAETQLLPVPVINRALRLNQSTDQRRKPSSTDDVSYEHEADQGDTIAEQTGAEGKRDAMRGGQGLDKGT